VIVALYNLQNIFDKLVTRNILAIFKCVFHALLGVCHIQFRDGVFWEPS